MDNSTAGSSECYWFEWETGVVSLIELLDPDSEVSAVAFQLTGAKGWDDVGVRLKDGTTRLIQAKHTRAGDRITFGDVVYPTTKLNGDEKASLLKSLSTAWQSTKADYPRIECCLSTNREAGAQWWHNRPPLNDFIDLLKEKLKDVEHLSEISWEGEDQRYEQVWPDVIEQLSGLDDPEKLEFLRSFSIVTDAADLDDLELKIFERLGVLSGLPAPSVKQLFNAVLANLRLWTGASRRDHEWVDREMLLKALSGDDPLPIEIGNCTVETPDPFFLTRDNVVDKLRCSLLEADSAHKIDYLSAPPGEGKTSCISRLSRVGAIRWSDQLVSIRYYAYQPIRPGEDLLSEDFGVASTPEALWKSLLWQMRDNLRKTRALSELRVPVWIDGMSWNTARAHVLRIADKLGQEWQRPFVLCIDGLDHAARARKRGMTEFLKTIPSPDAVPENVRILLSGQPAESYPEYPPYLKAKHDKVRVHELNSLEVEDIELLVNSATDAAFDSHVNAIARFVGEQANYRTLSVVYLVEAGRQASTVKGFLKLVGENTPPDSLHEYYESIWTATNVDHLVRLRLAAAFVLLKERPTAKMLCNAFQDMGKSAGEWNDYMRSMRPIVREVHSGFELVHNDVRVYLEGILFVENRAAMEASSTFADYYRSDYASRDFAQSSLLELLKRANRDDEFADDFTSDWVLEAASLGQFHLNKIRVECEHAFSGAVRRQDWILLHQVACASLTAYKVCFALRDCGAAPLGFSSSERASTFLPIEGGVLPLECWALQDFYELISGVEELCNAAEVKRARTVLKQTIGSIPLQGFVSRIQELLSSGECSVVESSEVKKRFKRLGYFYNRCEIEYTFDSSDDDVIELYLNFEQGWVRGFSENTLRIHALRQWVKSPPRYICSWMIAARDSYELDRFGECHAFLKRLVDHYGKLSLSEQIEFGFWAERCAVDKPELWRMAIEAPKFGFDSGSASYADVSIIARWITYIDSLREPAQVVEDLIELLDQERLSRLKSSLATRLIIRANAVLGLIYRCTDLSSNGDLEEYMSASNLRDLLTQLLLGEFDWHDLPDDERSSPRELGLMIVRAIGRLPSQSCHRVISDVAMVYCEKSFFQEGAIPMFEWLLNSGEELFLRDLVESKLAEFENTLHEVDPTVRRSYVVRIDKYCNLLGMASDDLVRAYNRNQIGYNGNDDWTFRPICRWLSQVRSFNPGVWKAEGIEALELDHICELQYGENQYQGELLSELLAASMQLGYRDFLTLFQRIASKESVYSLYDLKSSTMGALISCISESEIIDHDMVCSVVSLVLGLSTWPSTTPIDVINELCSSVDNLDEMLKGRLVSMASDMQGLDGLSVESLIENEVSRAVSPSRQCPRAMIEDLRSSKGSSLRLEDFIKLFEVVAEGEFSKPDRDQMISEALGILEDSDSLTRYVQYHDSKLAECFCSCLREQELWRLLGALTDIIGLPENGYTDADWSFMVAFSAVDLVCQAKCKQEESRLAEVFLRQTLDMHRSWVSAQLSLELSPSPAECSGWVATGVHLLLSLSQTTACQTLYMSMAGLRFLAGLYPIMIPDICLLGVVKKNSIDVILAMGELWAAQYPDEFQAAVPAFTGLLKSENLYDRLCAWIVLATYAHRQGIRPVNFHFEEKDTLPEIVFPGDSELIGGAVEHVGKFRHNDFSRMMNDRMDRIARFFGDLSTGKRHMVSQIKSGQIEIPAFAPEAEQVLAPDASFPRPRQNGRTLVGNALEHQWAGKTMPAGIVSILRLVWGGGMDPWVSSVSPNQWTKEELWPNCNEVDHWVRAGAESTDEVGTKLQRLAEGRDLPESMVQLGAVLSVPTYSHDIEYHHYKLNALDVTDDIRDAQPARTPTGRTFAGRFPGWSFPGQNSASVYFVGELVEFPYSDLELTPTDDWLTWGWRQDPSNPLQFIDENDNVVARYERWMLHDSHSNPHRPYRQAYLNRWVAFKDSLPNGLREWQDYVTQDFHRLENPD